MRVQNPLIYGEKLLSLVLTRREHYTAAQLEKMYGGSEININFPKNIWVHLTYQTAFVDEDGKLQLREDVYGRDARMIAILKGSERKVADIAIEHRPDPSSKPVRVPVGMYGGDAAAIASGGFFDFLFGGPHSAPSTEPIGRRARSARAWATTDAIRSAERLIVLRSKTPASHRRRFCVARRLDQAPR